MRLVIPEEFISESSAGPGKRDITVPTVGDLVNRRSRDKFPFITASEDMLASFDGDAYPEFSGKYKCMTVDDRVFELQASAVDLLTGEANGHIEVLDIQDIRAGCSAYIAGQVIPKEELLQNGGMMYQYTKYLTSDEPMVDSMRSLLREHCAAGTELSAQRDTADLDRAAEELAVSQGAETGIEY